MSKKILVLVLFLAAVVSVQAAEVVNGNFETGVLAPWWTYTPTSSSVTVLPTGGFGGSVGVELTNTGASEDVKLGQDFAAAPGDQTLSLAYKTEWVPGSGWAGATVNVRYLDASWALISEIYPNLSASADWTTANISLSAPTNTAFIELVLKEWAGGGGTANTYFDNVTIPEPVTMVLLGLGGLFLRRKSS